MKKNRLQFDFTEERVTELDELKKKINANNRAETVRRALHFFGWAIDKAEKGESINLTPDLLAAICEISLNKKRRLR